MPTVIYIIENYSINSLAGIKTIDKMSTRLPPKGNRKGGKQSKAGRRKLVEMENAGTSIEL